MSISSAGEIYATEIKVMGAKGHGIGIAPIAEEFGEHYSS
jgi:hypothetical protein